MINTQNLTICKKKYKAYLNDIRIKLKNIKKEANRTEIHP